MIAQLDPNAVISASILEPEVRPFLGDAYIDPNARIQVHMGILGTAGIIVMVYTLPRGYVFLLYSNETDVMLRNSVLLGAEQYIICCPIINDPRIKHGRCISAKRPLCRSLHLSEKHFKP